jgi:DMSO/TMAO reductase YedYZ molybdopterin-dependent catalytic subunit
VRDIKVRTSFVRSMGVVDATGPDNLLCYEMNGAPLPPEHGFPLQLIAPGWYGIANVKRLRGIEVRATRLENRFMGRPDRSYVRNSGAVQTKAKVRHPFIAPPPVRA